MNKNKILFGLLWLLTLNLFGQELKLVDELGSPIREVLLKNEDESTHVYSNRDGLVSLTIFSSEELIYISRSGFLSTAYKKRDLQALNYELRLIFDSEMLGEIIIQTRLNDENLKTTAVRSVILHSKEIERLNTQTTADLLEKRAGINVQKSQMGGGSPVIRGFEANRVLLVLDGVRMNNAIYRSGHLQNIISVDNASLERVDIIFGPSSSKYGSDALGGVIHLQTKRPKFTDDYQWKHSYLSRYSSANNGLSKHYEAQYTGPSFSLYSSISHSDFDDLMMGKRRSHGYKDWGLVYEYAEDGEQVANDNVNLQRNTGYSQTDFMQKVILKLDEGITLTGNFQFSNSSDVPRFDKYNDYPSDQVFHDTISGVTDYGDLKYAEWNYGPQKKYFSSLQLDVSVDNAIMDSAQYIIAYQDVYESRHSRKMGDDTRVDRYENVDVYSVNANFQKKSFNYGLEYYYNDVNSTAFDWVEGKGLTPNEQTRYPNGGSNMSSYSAFITYAKNFGERFRLNTGMRYTQNELKAIFHNTTTFSLAFDSIGYKYEALTGNISLAYHPNDSWKIATIFSTGFHAPNIDDVGKLFIKGGIITIPNFNLAPEHARNIELNISKNIDNKVLINANAFYTFLDDAIMKVDADLEGFTINPEEHFTDVKTNKNTGQAKIYGLTASVSMRFAGNYTFESDYTLIKGRNITTGLPFTHIPPSFGKLALYADFDNWRASFYTLYNGRKAIDEYDFSSGTDNEEESPYEWIYSEESGLMEFEPQGTPAWYTLNMSAMYRVSDNFTVQMALENMLDQHYKTFSSGLSAPGRNFVLTLRANL